MYDYRLAQERCQDTVNKASAKRRQKTADHKSESTGIRKLLAMVTSFLRVPPRILISNFTLLQSRN